MPDTGVQVVKPKYHAIIHLRGTEDKQLDEAEQRCREYASRFGWHVLESIRDSKASTTPGQILAKVCRPGAHILLTDTPDMISPDKPAQRDLIMAIEGTGYIVHPISTPSRP
jgi:hypothetical protein